MYILLTDVLIHECVSHCFCSKIEITSILTWHKSQQAYTPINRKIVNSTPRSLLVPTFFVHSFVRFLSNSFCFELFRTLLFINIGLWTIETRQWLRCQITDTERDWMTRFRIGQRISFGSSLYLRVFNGEHEPQIGRKNKICRFRGRGKSINAHGFFCSVFTLLLRPKRSSHITWSDVWICFFFAWIFMEFFPFAGGVISFGEWIKMKKSLAAK